MSSLGRPIDSAPRVGRIRISSANTDKNVGRYVSRNFVESSGAFKTTTSPDEALQVRISPADRSEAVQILNPASNLKWMGLTYKGINGNFGAGATGWAAMTMTAAPGAPVQTVAKDPFIGPVYSSCWNVTLDGRFIANVCDSDGIFYKVEPLIQLNQPGIYFVHNKKVFIQNNTPARTYAEMELIFEPISNYSG